MPLHLMDVQDITETEDAGKVDLRKKAIEALPKMAYDSNAAARVVDILSQLCTTYRKFVFSGIDKQVSNPSLPHH